MASTRKKPSRAPKKGVTKAKKRAACNKSKPKSQPPSFCSLALPPLDRSRHEARQRQSVEGQVSMSAPRQIPRVLTKHGPSKVARRRCLGSTAPLGSFSGLACPSTLPITAAGLAATCPGSKGSTAGFAKTSPGSKGSRNVGTGYANGQYWEKRYAHRAAKESTYEWYLGWEQLRRTVLSSLTHESCLTSVICTFRWVLDSETQIRGF